VEIGANPELTLAKLNSLLLPNASIAELVLLASIGTTEGTYVYVGSNPTRWGDPTGKSVVGVIVIVVVGVATAYTIYKTATGAVRAIGAASSQSADTDFKDRARRKCLEYFANPGAFRNHAWWDQYCCRELGRGLFDELRKNVPAIIKGIPGSSITGNPVNPSPSH